MELIIGGSFQGKLDYVKRKLQEGGVAAGQGQIVEGDSEACVRLLAGEPLPGGGPLVLNRLHLLVRRKAREGTGQKLYESMEVLLENNPDCIIVCDEVGCGVLPADREEREYREDVGRMLCFLTERAGRVERVTGGLPLRIK